MCMSTYLFPCSILSCLPSSGCLAFCLCLSVLTLLLQSLWVPLEVTSDEPAGRSPEQHGNLDFCWHERCCSGMKFQSRISVKESFCTQAVVGPTFGPIVMGSAGRTEYHWWIQQSSKRFLLGGDERGKETGLFVEHVFTGADRCFRHHIFFCEISIFPPYVLDEYICIFWPWATCKLPLWVIVKKSVGGLWKLIQ